MTSEPVDILIPNRNYGKYLDQAIQSCFDQTYKNINVIIVDDNSTDNSREVLKKYEDRCKIIYVDDNNPNIAKTRNILIENSSSPYLCFLSSDDYYKHDFIEKSLNFLVGHPSDEIGGVYGLFSWVDEDGKFLRYFGKPSYRTKEDLHAACIRPDCVVTFETSLFKRSVFTTDQKFDTEVIYGEETHFIAMMTKRFHFLKHVNNESLSFKRKHVGQGHSRYTSFHRQTLADKIMGNIT